MDRLAILRDDWVRTPARAGDVVHLIGHWTSRAPASPARLEVALEGIDVPFAAEEQLTSASLPTMTLSSDDSLDPRTGKKESENMLVLHPDTLLSATAISSAVISCSRKAVLQSKVKASGPGADERPTEALILGKMLHEVLQSCLTGNATKREIVDCQTYEVVVGQHAFLEASTFPTSWSGPASTNFSEIFVKQQIISQVFNCLEDVLHVGLETRAAVEKLWVATLPFGSFASVYLNCPQGTQAGTMPNPKAEAMDARSSLSPLVRVTQVYDVEEDIWSVMYGLKGFVDVSVEIELTERSAGRPDLSRKRTMMMPLELKTGRSINVAEHRAQTMLYTLMMSDRYDSIIDCGLLYYSKDAEMHLVRSAQHELRGLMQARNELASYMVRGKLQDAPHGFVRHPDTIDGTLLPPTIDNERSCSRCYVAETCMLYRGAVDGVDDEEDALEGLEPSPLLELSNRHTAHLTLRHLSFFRHWDELLAYEESDVLLHRREMWTMTAEARERLGRCYANMVMCENLTPASSATASQARLMSGMNQCHLYRFQRAKTQSQGQMSEGMLGGNFAVGDAICVSIDPALLSIAQGFVFELSPSSLVVGLDKKLETIIRRANLKKRCIFRIDKEEQISGMARTRYNLAKLFFALPAGDARRRELVVDLKAPTFLDARPDETTTDLMEGLNEDQSAAISKALRADDYALIVGMPGTGKTTTIARLIALLARQGKSVLLTSYTHSAVDTICRKLLDYQSDARLLRLGSTERVHSDIHPFMLKQAQSAEHLREQVVLPNVVATPCLSIGHVLFSLRTFDYCIVDEASQITLPACLGPLRYARKFILVGDPQQLPPLVKDPRARKGGLDVSLFERLQRAHPSSAAHLCHQYRMNEDIMALSNALTYDNMLRCGTEEVRAATVHVPNMRPALSLAHNSDSSTGCDGQCWLFKAVLPSNRALFIDTDDMHAYEHRSGDLVENLSEAKLVVQLITTLVSSGVNADDIAVITPYRQQIRRLTQLLKSQRHADLSSVEVWTADKSQGRDKDVVIVTFVRSIPPLGDHELEGRDGGQPPISSTSTSVGQLLHDVRRINVSLTRAKKKLVLIGSRQSLVRVPLLAKLWTIMHQRGWTCSPSFSQRDAHDHLTAPSSL
jgi:DNA replication ATP-dependent helicase Dna2